MVKAFVWAAPLLLAATPALGQTSPRELVEMTDFSGLAVSPDGRWLLYRRERPSTVTGRIDTDWYIVAADGSSSPRHAGSGGAATWNGTGIVDRGAAAWAADSRSFYVRALVDEGVVLLEGTPDGGALVPVITGDSDVERFATDADGGLIYELGPTRAEVRRAENTERDSGIIVDGRVDLAQTLYRGAMIAGRPASQRLSGDWFDREPLLAKAPRQAFVHPGNGGLDRSASARETARLNVASAPLPDVLLQAAAQQGICPHAETCPASGDARIWSHVALADGGYVIVTRDRDIRQDAYRWSHRDGLKLLARSEGLLGGGGEMEPCAANREALFCVVESATAPPELIRIRLADGALTRLDNPNDLPDRDDLLTEAVEWRVGGSRASGWLVRPKIPGRLPLFVTYYRCAGFMRGGLGNEWPLRALAANGIAALCINQLRSPAASAEARYGLGLEAVRTAIAELDGRGLVDTARVGMGGLSFGSEVTMWTATHSNLLRAISIASVQAEPAYYWFNAGAGRDYFRKNLLRNWGLGSPDTDFADWRRRSPSLNVDRIRAPVLMQLPEQEARQSPELVARVTFDGMGELVAFPYAPHIKVEPRQKLAVYQRNLDWFRYWLRGEVDSDPDKAAQYRRWGALAFPRPTPATDAIQSSISTNSIRRK